LLLKISFSLSLSKIFVERGKNHADRHGESQTAPDDNAFDEARQRAAGLQMKQGKQQGNTTIIQRKIIQRARMRYFPLSLRIF